MLKRIIQCICSVLFVFMNFTSVSAMPLNSNSDIFIRSDFYPDDNGQLHKISTILIAKNKVNIVDEFDVLIASVEFSSDLVFKKSDKLTSTAFNSQAYTLSYTSSYNVWNPNYSFPYGQSHYTITFYDTVVIPNLRSALAATITLLITTDPAVSIIIGFVYGLADNSISDFIKVNGTFKNTYYWRKYFSLNVFCPILGRPQFRYYTSSSYAVLKPSSSFVTPTGIAEWYGGTPYDFTQPSECRDLVLQYSY